MNEEIGEFWLENPWDDDEHNLSAYERNRVLLNRQDGRYVDVSHLTGGADLDSDSRGVVAGDFDNDGRTDIIVRSSGGGAVRLFMNRTSQPGNWITVRLQGTKSNRQGLGARVEVVVGESTYSRELYPHNGFEGQGAPLLSFGLGTHEQIDRLTVHWPSGAVQELTGVATNQLLEVTEPDAAN